MKKLLVVIYLFTAIQVCSQRLSLNKMDLIFTGAGTYNTTLDQFGYEFGLGVEFLHSRARVRLTLSHFPQIYEGDFNEVYFSPIVAYDFLSVKHINAYFQVGFASTVWFNNNSYTDKGYVLGGGISFLEFKESPISLNISYIYMSIYIEHFLSLGVKYTFKK